jgi:hypothetical protein
MENKRRSVPYLFRLLPLFLILVSLGMSAQETEFTFDVDEFARKAFSLDGYFEFRPSLSRLREDSSLFTLRYYNRDPRKFLEQGDISLLAGLSYRKGIFEAFLEPYLDYTTSPYVSETGASLFQGYVSMKPSPSLTFFAGKRTLRWGKGYAWSPTALVERAKNPNEPDLAREGYWMITADYTKSFEGPLKTLSITPVFIPVSRSINSAFSPTDGLNAAGKIYVLFLDTDIDLVVLAGKNRSTSFGLDFSRNLLSNWEVHGEMALNRDAASYLLGTRFLSAVETTYILEYYHNGNGYNAREFDGFYSLVERAYGQYLASGADSLLREAAGWKSYSGFAPMTDYMFLRIAQKDPFGLLYVNPASTLFVNLLDGSFSWAPELIYKGITNLELRLKATFLIGKNGEEFGEKPFRYRVELRSRYFF